MTKRTHHVHFVENIEVVKEIDALAEKEGLQRSDIIRQGVRMRLGKLDVRN